MANGNGGKGTVKEFLKDAALGAVAGATVDGFLEISRFPVANEAFPSSLQFAGGEQLSNAEAVIYGLGTIAFVAGLLDVVGGKPIIPGWGKTLTAYGGGAILGTSFYESNISRWLGIREVS